MALAYESIWDSTHSVLLDKCSNARTPTELRLITVILGALTSYMAIHSLDNHNYAMRPARQQALQTLFHRGPAWRHLLR